MSQDTTRRPSTEELAPPPAAFLPCSDCRAPMRNHYFALDTRPVCPRCRMGYEKRIAYGTGPGSLGRVLLWGGGAALAGSVVLGFMGWWVSIFRLFMAIGVAYFVGRAINKATGDYYLRRNQVIGALFVYFAVGLSGLVPVITYAVRMPPPAPAPVAPNMQAMADSIEQAADEAEAVDIYDSARASRAAQLAERDKPEYQRQAEDLRRAGAIKGIFVAIVLLVTLPLLSALGFGIYGASAALVALGYAVRKVWEMTGDGVSYELSGPHRVGTGPIPSTF